MLGQLLVLSLGAGVLVLGTVLGCAGSVAGPDFRCWGICTGSFLGMCWVSCWSCLGAGVLVGPLGSGVLVGPFLGVVRHQWVLFGWDISGFFECWGISGSFLSGIVGPLSAGVLVGPFCLG